MKTIFWHFINLLILGSILYILLRNRISEYFKERSETIKRAFDNLEETKREVREKFTGYEERLNESEKEIKEIIESFRKDGEREKNRIIDNANREAEIILERGRFAMEQELKKAKLKLQEEASTLAISTAENIIKRSLKKEDHERLINDYVNRVRRMN
jgi:F-type H+-transporting ATPase subunit b